jgi:hypothetical protein
MSLHLTRRNPAWLALAVPWAIQWQNRHPGIRGRLRYAMELPGWAVIDLVEIVAMLRGSVRHRSILL